MAKQAPLGFRVLGLSGELRVPDERDFEKEMADKAVNSLAKARARKLRCYRKHADQYNRARRAVARSVAGRYKEAKANAIKRNDGWDFTYETWERAWRNAGSVLIPGSVDAVHNPHGDVVPAYALRGSHSIKNTCMQRIDTNKAWSPSNYKVMFRGEPLGPANRWWRPAHSAEAGIKDRQLGNMDASG